MASSYLMKSWNLRSAVASRDKGLKRVSEQSFATSVQAAGGEHHGRAQEIFLMARESPACILTGGVLFGCSESGERIDNPVTLMWHPTR